MHTPVCKSSAILIGFTLVILFGTVPVEAAVSYETELITMGQQIAKAIKGYGEDSVSIGQFVHPTLADVSGGTGIARILSETLMREGITVKQRANLGLAGEFVEKRDERRRLTAWVEGKVKNRTGEVLFTFQRNLVGVESLVSLFGITAELPPELNGPKREAELEQRIDKPQAHVQKTRISAGPQSPYAVELWVREAQSYQPRSALLEEGQAFVRLRRDEIYAINLINDSPHDVAVQLSIDGMSMFAFSENTNYRHVIVPAKSQGFIKGWHRNNQVSDSFLITNYAKSAAAELLPQSPSIGTITAIFSAAWPKGQRPPQDEPDLGTRGDDATGRGPEVKQKYEEVERIIGVPRAAVSVRYLRNHK